MAHWSGQGLPTNVPWVQFLNAASKQMWVEFVVGSAPCSKGFSPSSLIFLLSQKSTLLNSNSIWRHRMKCHSVEVFLQITIIIVIVIIINYYYLLLLLLLLLLLSSLL